MDQLIHVDINQLIRALEQTLSPDQCLLDASYRFLEAVARDENSFAWLTAALANLAVGSRNASPTAASPLGSRETALCQQAAIQLKNLVRHHGCRWLQLASAQRSRTKTVLLGGLGAVTTGNELSDRQCSSALSQCIQAVAELELPQGTWPELIPQLVALIINNGNGGGGGDNAVTTANMAAAVVAGSLETLGFICETVSPACLEQHVNQLLTAVVYGMQEDAFPAAVNLAAVRALTPLLALATANFARRPERNYIMQVET
jgi:importin subunit beta-1